MSAEHTPGPWYVTGSDENGAMVVSQQNVPDPTVARWPLFGATREAVANANLQAAAPAMLAALEWALCHVRFSGGPEGDAETFSANYNAAQSAIAQAKGEK